MKETPASEAVSVESLLGRVADEFTQRIARGEQPDIEEYAQRYPQIAGVIREVFSALQVLPVPADSAAGMRHASSAELPAAAVLGDYRLVREIGRGGMGVVYEAEQMSLRRRVALKVLSFAAVLDSKQLQRFKNEAQAAAQLHHTNIVPVFSVGCERGVHYYAMQYIEGQPLSAVIRELRQLGGMDATGEHTLPAGRPGVPDAVASSGCATTAPSFTGSSAAAGLLGPEGSGSFATITTEGSARGRALVRSVANLAVQAAEALEYAHERGVIHRDIKPSNLLLDTEGRLWVADFGLATVQTDSGLTLTGDIVGTIRYMSPEQALARRVPVDHRTDIYSLGATLYELLALTPAFAGGDRQDLLRQIAFDEPRPLRQRNRAIPREMEIIVGKAMAKNPAERYATARELADDLRRFLEDKPILAKPPTVLDRAAKWSRRHRSVVAAGIVLLILSVAGLSVSTVMIAREREKAVRERDAAQEQRQRAERNLRAAREVVDRMLADVSATDPAMASGAEPLQLALRQEALADAKARADRSNEPAARRDLAAAYVRLAQTCAQLGQDEPAEQAYREAGGILEALRKDSPDTAEDAVQLAQADLCLGAILWKQRRYTEAEASLRESIGIRRAIVSEFSQSIERRQQNFELACTQRNLADLLLKAGRREEAEGTSRESITMFEHLANWFPDVELYATELARTRRWWDEVLRLADQQAASVAPGGPLVDPDGPASGYRQMLAATHRIITEAIEGEADAEAADAAYRRAVSVVEQWVRQHPAETRYREDLLELHRAHAARTRELWLLDQSEAAFQKAVEILEQLVAEHPTAAGYRDRLENMRHKRDVIRGRRPVGELMLLSKGSPEEIARAVELARNVDLALIATNAPVLTICADHLALGCDYARAEALARKATEVDPTDIAAWKSLGWALEGLGRHEEGRAALRHALGVLNIRTGEQAVGACPEPSTMGYLLGMVSRERYVSRWQGVKMYGSRFDPWPWFFVGVRMELDGRRAEAEAAYRTCAGLDVVPRAHYTARWAAYRLKMLTATAPSAR